mgnify:CR=1 FL=1
MNILHPYLEHTVKLMRGIIDFDEAIELLVANTTGFIQLSSLSH